MASTFVSKQRGMNVILLSHVASKAYKDPELEPYDRWEMRCNKKVNALIKDWVDFNLFANYETTLIKDGAKARGRQLWQPRFIYQVCCSV